MARHVEVMRLNYTTCEVYSHNLTLAKQSEWQRGFERKVAVDLSIFLLSVLLAVLCALRGRICSQRSSSGEPGKPPGPSFASEQLPLEIPLLDPRASSVPPMGWKALLGGAVDKAIARWKSIWVGQPVFCNYMSVLRIGFKTWCTLFLISYICDSFLISDGGDPGTTARTVWGLSMMFKRGKFYQDLLQGRSGNLRYLLAAVFLKGLVVLLSTWFLEWACVQPAVSDAVRSTIWIHSLPVQDQRRTWLFRETFKLSPDQLKRVSQELAIKIDEHMDRGKSLARTRTPGATRAPRQRGSEQDASERGNFYNEDTQKVSHVAQHWVAPNVKKWRRISNELEHRIRQQEAYREWTMRYSAGHDCWSEVWKWYFDLRLKSCTQGIEKLERSLLKIRLQKMTLNGCAFVQFRTPKEAKDFFGETPKTWDCLWWFGWKTFNFGHVPFSSVTLEYEPVPHPDDIIWDNIDNPPWCGRLAFLITSIFMFLMVFLMGLLISLPTALQWLAEGDMYDLVSPLLLLIVNATLLPLLVHGITSAAMLWSRAKVESHYFGMNFWLIVWSMILVLLLRSSHLPQWLNLLYDWKLFECMIWDLHLDPGELSLGYLLDVFLLTNAYQVLAFLRHRCRAQLCARVVTRRAIDNGNVPQGVPLDDVVRPPKFPFSFHYAWTLSVMALSLWTSNEVPGILLLAALYLLFKGCIDWCNLHAEVFVMGPEYDGGMFMNRIIACIRIIAGIFWLTSGASVEHLFCSSSRWSDETVCPWWASYGSWLLMVAGVVVLVFGIGLRVFADNKLRFVPGRVPEAKKKEEPKEKQPEEERPDPELSSPGVETEHAQERTALQWDAQPEFKSAVVEEIVQSISLTPSLEGSVHEALREGKKTVQEILADVRGCRRTRSCDL